ncbi:MAG: hypothetical protein QM541_14475 [Flavobacterium sp.]|nr:hypothetical protein [Flavobacterium sp.]
MGIQNKFPLDKVKLCSGKLCIEARGDNGKLLTITFAFVLIGIGIAALAKAS